MTDQGVVPHTCVAKPTIWKSFAKPIIYTVILNENNIIIENSNNKYKGFLNQNKKVLIFSNPIIQKYDDGCITIKEDLTKKSKKDDYEQNYYIYELNEAQFAGGCFIISLDKKLAELIIYGSGRPIISWNKGILKSK